MIKINTYTFALLFACIVCTNCEITDKELRDDGDAHLSSVSSSSLDNNSSSLLLSSSSSDAKSIPESSSLLEAIESSSSIEQSSSSEGDPLSSIVIETGSFIDSRDSQTYPWTKIGDQVWMGSNLNYADAEGSSCYDDSLIHCETYGRLYSWNNAMAGAVSDSNTLVNNDSTGMAVIIDGAVVYVDPESLTHIQGICPNDWHLPSDLEWRHFTYYLNVTNTNFEIFDFGEWGNLASENNLYQFSALPAGYCLAEGTCHGLTEVGIWWSATDYFDNFYSEAKAGGSMLHTEHFNMLLGSYDKGRELSVRCIKD